MNQPKGNILLMVKVAALYIGAVIGAGFATGQEIMQFFVLHGSGGLVGALLATALFTYLGGLVMYISIKKRSVNYREVFALLIGPKAGKFMDVLNLLMLLGGLCVMMAGSAAVFGELFGLPAVAGILAVAAITSLVILGGLDGVLLVNVFLVPIKLIVITAISLAALGVAGDQVALAQVTKPDPGVAGHWAISGILYVSYNIVVPLAVLSTLGRIVPLRVGVAGGMLGGLFLGMAVLMVTMAGLAYMPEVAFYEIPTLYLAGSLGSGFRWILGFLIWLAILTTAMADAHGFASRLAPEGGPRYRFCGIGACLLVLPLSSLSFSGLVRFLYPLFGCVGLLLFISLVLTPFARYFKKY